MAKSIEKIVKKRLVLCGTDSANYHDCLNVAVCADKNVVLPLGVLIYSVLRNAAGEKYVFHIFFNGELLDEDIRRIRSLGKSFSSTIIVYTLDNDFFSGFYTAGYLTITAYYRLLVPYVLNQYNIESCLYLDTDIIVVSNIDDIFYFAQDDIAYVIGDSTSSPEKWKHYCRAIGMKTNKYFNSGILLLNISKYLKNDIGIKALLLLKNNQYKYMDQDVLNILLEGKCSYDPDITYNCTMSVTNDKYQKYLDDGIKIVHFTGDKKPWKLFTSIWGERNNPASNNDVYAWKYQYYRKWREYAKVSPWMDVPLSLPQNAHEWRYLSRMYLKTGNYVHALKAYARYLMIKFTV